ncbi:hypothetical protein GIB67_007489 [Kingdonia uniflora]|uniref:Golgin candidate 4 n=1 Tax=Kingdonia uniflora TaxID=39325 RepID=A0A7J7LVX7_9MAGN|nr:hypothetical protein GIB67_007489 [Kingdonia uniflora]
MMWNTIANFKENLNQIALEVQDANDELEIYRSSSTGGGDDASSLLDRRVSHRFAQSKSPLRSVNENGVDSGLKSEVEQYKTEIQRLHTSEAEIKALSVNYAALLREKEEQLSKLHAENGSLKRNLDASNAVRYASRNESLKTLTSNSNVVKETSDRSPRKQYRVTNQVNNSTGNHSTRGTVPKQDGLANGGSNGFQTEGVQSDAETKLAGLQEEHNRSLAATRANYESKIKQLRTELDKERNNLSKVQLKLQEESVLNGTFKNELLDLKSFKEKNNTEMKELKNELNEKISEIRRLQLELSRRDSKEVADETVDNLKRVIESLEQENIDLKKAHLPKTFIGKEEMELSMQKLEKDLKEACRERDKTSQQLTRLKQHLLDKELEESDKMDEDSKIIEELRGKCDYQKAQISHLERSLKQAIVSQDEVKKTNNSELLKAKEVITDLKQKLTSSMSTVDAKNAELLNLQTALGQYYAESEAKERLERDFILSREESAKLSNLLKDANQHLEMSKKEKEEILANLSKTDRMLSEGKLRVHKLEEDNMKLRRALEQSMTRLNRMSMDSDYFVDRRIVIKLLVTYFQRNHSKEVLDLMVRMLGFSEEDKQRIGVAQQGSGKGVVRGVFGLPGRLVGGILGGNSSEVSTHAPSDNQSFADMWVDFLLTETQKRESSEVDDTAVPAPEYSAPSASSNFHGVNPSTNQSSTTPVSSRRNPLQRENSDTEFSTVPLTSSVSPPSVNSSRISRLLPRY